MRSDTSGWEARRVCLNSEGAPFKLGLSEDFDPAVHSAHIHLGVWPAQALSRVSLPRKSLL